MRLSRLLTLVAPLAALAGCGTTALTGLYGAESQFSCKAPKGAACLTMDEAYHRSVEGRLPAASPAAGSEGAAAPGEAAAAQTARLSPAAHTAASAGTPLRSAPMQLRIWVAPWEDAHEALHDQSYIYLPVHAGRWMLEAVRDNAIQAFRRVRAPAQPRSAAGGQPSAAPGADAAALAQGLANGPAAPSGEPPEAVQ